MVIGLNNNERCFIHNLHVDCGDKIMKMFSNK